MMLDFRWKINGINGINGISPPEELGGIFGGRGAMLALLVAMVVADAVFLQSAFSVGLVSDNLAVPAMLSVLAATIGIPRFAAWLIGGAIDAKDKSAALSRYVIAAGLLALLVVLIVWITVFRFDTIGIAEGESTETENEATYDEGDADTAASDRADADEDVASDEQPGKQDIVWIMTVMLLASAMFSFGLGLVDCCITVRTPLVESYRRRHGPKVLAKIDAIAAGLQERNVEKQRREDRENLAAAISAAVAEAVSMNGDLRRRIAIEQGDPAALPIAMEGYPINRRPKLDDGEARDGFDAVGRRGESHLPRMNMDLSDVNAFMNDWRSE